MTPSNWGQNPQQDQQQQGQWGGGQQQQPSGMRFGNQTFNPQMQGAPPQGQPMPPGPPMQGPPMGVPPQGGAPIGQPPGQGAMNPQQQQAIQMWAQRRQGQQPTMPPAPNPNMPSY